MKPTILILFISLIINHTACQPSNSAIKSPQGYDLSKPVVFKMPKIFDEISGIAFLNGQNDKAYAIQDEEGLLLQYTFENKNYKSFKFAKKGDYEDVAIGSHFIIILRSDGTILTTPLSFLDVESANNMSENKNILPKGEYEGLYLDDSTKTVYVLCKECKNDKDDKKVSGYILKIDSTNMLRDSSRFNIDVKAIEQVAGVKKIHFQPSALAKNNRTNEWYILSAANDALVITDTNWQVKEVYYLTPRMFKQPEGIAFDNAGNLYISNEKGNGNNGSILKFIYQKAN